MSIVSGDTLCTLLVIDLNKKSNNKIYAVYLRRKPNELIGFMLKLLEETIKVIIYNKFSVFTKTLFYFLYL